MSEINFYCQCQAIVVGFLGSVAALIMEASKTQTFNLDHAFLLCASSLVTASIASFVLGELEKRAKVRVDKGFRNKKYALRLKVQIKEKKNARRNT